MKIPCGDSPREESCGKINRENEGFEVPFESRDVLEMRGNTMKAIVFDMDGVLFDTEMVCLEGWKVVAEKNNLPDMENVFTKCIGLNNTDCQAVLQDAYGADFDYGEFRKQASAEFWGYIETKGLPEKTGVHELLGWLRGSDYKVALASSTRRSSVLNCLENAGILDYFEVIISGDMVEHSKPEPDIYLLACERLGVEPGEAYAIEDSFNGIRSAHAAGMNPIMVPDMLAPDAEMQEKSVAILKDLLEVLEYLK